LLVVQLQRFGEAMQLYDEQKREYEQTIKRYGRSKTSPPPEEPVKPLHRRFMCGDVTIEALVMLLGDNPRGLLVARDELAGWFGSFDAYKKARTDAQQWLEMHKARSIAVDRKTGDQRATHVARALVNITGGIQPDILRNALTRENFSNGMAARLLFTMPPKRPRTWRDDDLSDLAVADLERLCERLHSLQADEQGDPIELPLDADAMPLWVDFYNAHGAELHDKQGDEAAAWSKLECYAARMALLLHLLWWAEDDSPVVDQWAIAGDSMARAIQLVEWFKYETRRVYCPFSETEIDRRLRKLCEYVESHGGVAKLRDIQRAMGYAHADDVRADARMLEHAHIGTVEQITRASGGRPSKCFRLTVGDDTDKTPAGEPVGGVVSVSEDGGER
jgi:hypothetical protein